MPQGDGKPIVLERRRLPRWLVKRKAQLYLDDADEPCDVFVQDMNLKGMQISLDATLPDTEVFGGRLRIANQLDLSFEAAAPWTRESAGQHVYGLSFRRVKDLDRDRIFEFINSEFTEQLRKQWWGAEEKPGSL